MKNTEASLDFWKLTRFYLHDYMPNIRMLSLRSVETYRQAIMDFLHFLRDCKNIDPRKIVFADFSRETIKEYISWCHKTKKYAVSTCNLRLSVLKSFLSYCADEDLLVNPLYLSVKTIHMLSEPRKLVEYLSENALKVLLDQPDVTTKTGYRDMMIMIVMYDSGCRVQELVDILLKDLHFSGEKPFLTVTGKGHKTRTVPLMDKTVEHLKRYIKRYHPKELMESSLFYSRKLGVPGKLSTDAIRAILNKYSPLARQHCSEIPDHVYPHLLRKTRAMHLYMTGLPLTYVAQFLGHESMNTTGFYAYANFDMLSSAIKKANPELSEIDKNWGEPDILRLLTGL